MTQHSSPPSLNKMPTVINLSNSLLDDATHSASPKSQNYAASPLVLPTEDILTEV
jgi:hypothetical protein